MRSILYALTIVLTYTSVAVADRQKHALENFDLNSLQLKRISTLGESREYTAEIIGPDQFLYVVRKGDYLGRKHGKIIEIQLNMIEILEVEQDSSGSWFEVSRKLQVLSNRP